MPSRNDATPSATKAPFINHDINTPFPTSPPTRNTPYNLSIHHLQPALNKLHDPFLTSQKRDQLLSPHGPLQERWKEIWDLAAGTFNEHIRCQRCGQIPNQMMNHHMKEEVLRLGNALDQDMAEVQFRELDQDVLNGFVMRYWEIEIRYAETTVAHVDCGEVGWNGNRSVVERGL